MSEQKAGEVGATPPEVLIRLIINGNEIKIVATGEQAVKLYYKHLAPIIPALEQELEQATWPERSESDAS